MEADRSQVANQAFEILLKSGSAFVAGSNALKQSLEPSLAEDSHGTHEPPVNRAQRAGESMAQDSFSPIAQGSKSTGNGPQLANYPAAKLQEEIAEWKYSSATYPAHKYSATKSQSPRSTASAGIRSESHALSSYSPGQIRTAGAAQLFASGPGVMNEVEEKTGKPNSFIAWLQNWLSSDRRRAARIPLPGLVAYYWTGSAPRAYQIADISTSGFYLLTEERWFPGTMVLMTLQRTDSGGQNLDDSIAIQSRVVRWGSDGLGLAFVLSRGLDTSNPNAQREYGADKRTLDKFLSRIKDSSAITNFR